MEEKPKVAYIDYQDTLWLSNELRGRGIDVTAAHLLSDFQKDYSLDNFPVLLFHPGANHQPELGYVLRDFPRISLAIVTSPIGKGEYTRFRKRHPGFNLFSGFELDEIERFIRDNQN